MFLITYCLLLKIKFSKKRHTKNEKILKTFLITNNMLLKIEYIANTFPNCEFLKGIDINDNDCVDLPDNVYIENQTINNIKDLEKIVKMYEFFGCNLEHLSCETVFWIINNSLNGISVEKISLYELNSIKDNKIIYFIKKNNIKHVEYLAKKGVQQNKDLISITDSLEIVKILHHNCYRLSDDAIKNACYNNHFEILKYLIENPYEYKNEYLKKEYKFNKSNTKCAANNYECLLYLIENGFILDEDISVHAATSGNIQVLEYCILQGCKLDKKCTSLAAEKGHLEVLKVLHNNNCQWDEYVCNDAALYGHIHCLKYAHQNGAKFNLGILDNSVELGNLECVKYIYECGARERDDIIMKVVKYGYVDVLKYFLSKNYKLCDNADIYSVENNKLSMVQFLHEKGIIFTENALKISCVYGFTEIVQFLISIEYIFHMKHFTIACIHGHFEIVKMLYKDEYKHSEENVNLKISKLKYSEIIQILNDKRYNLGNEENSLLKTMYNLLKKLYGEEENEEYNLIKYSEENKELIKKLYSDEYKEYEEYITLEVTKNGNVDIINFLLEKGFVFSEKCFECACKKLHIDIVKLLSKDIYKNDDKYCILSSNSFNIFKYLYKNGYCVTSQKCFENYIENDNKNIIEYLISKKCEYNKNLCDVACYNNRLNILRMLHEDGCELTVSCYLTFIKTRNSHIFKYLLNNNCPIDTTLTETACKDGNMYVLKLFVDNGFPLSKMCFIYGYKNISIVQYLVNNKCPWDETVYEMAKELNCRPFLKFLKDNGCPC